MVINKMIYKAKSFLKVKIIKLKMIYRTKIAIKCSHANVKNVLYNYIYTVINGMKMMSKKQQNFLIKARNLWKIFKIVLIN